MLIQCIRCQVERFEDRFDTGRNICKDCRNAKKREKWAEMSLEDRQHHNRNTYKYKLKSLYNLSLEDYDRMLYLCGNRCEICRQPDKELVVDHCHTTGKVRGLLCRQCNVGIGNLQDDYEIVLNAYKYLEAPL